MVTLNYAKLPADRHVTVTIGPSGGTTLGITDIDVPTAAEINNDAGSGMVPASQSISWNDWDFGTQASETVNEPSLADAGSYVEFGQENYGGGISYFLPAEYDDDSNMHSVVYDLTDEKYHYLDVTVRIDGDVLTTVPAADGDFTSAYRVQSGGDANPFTPGESKRHTVTYMPKSDFAHYTVVGSHAITAIEPATYGVGTKGRIRASQGGRDTTNRLRFSTSDPAVIQVYPGGFYEVVGVDTDTATVTITDAGSGDTVDVTVAVTA